MPQVDILTVLVGGSSVIGVIAVLAYLYFLLEFRQAETSVRRLIEDEPFLSSKEIVQVLAQYKDDTERLKALKAITSWGTTRNKDLLQSVREKGVNLNELNRIRAKNLEKRSLLIAAFFFTLALVIVISPYFKVVPPDPSPDQHPLSEPAPPSDPGTKPSASTTVEPVPPPLPPVAPRTSIATLGFPGGTVESVEKVLPGGTLQQHGDGFVYTLAVDYDRYPFTGWFYFDSAKKAISIVAILKTEQQSRYGDYSNFQNGYDGDIFTYCNDAFKNIKSEISNKLGNPVSPVLTAQKVQMSADEIGVMVGGTGGRCHVPGNSCSMGGWKAGTRADFDADSGQVSLSMNTRAAERSIFVANKTDRETRGLCEIRLDGSF